MIIPVTAEIIGSIGKVKLVAGTNEEVGKILGVTKKHIGNILAGKIQYIQEDTWKKMEPHLNPFLPSAQSESAQMGGKNLAQMDAFDRAATFLRTTATKAQQSIIMNTLEQFGFNPTKPIKKRRTFELPAELEGQILRRCAAEGISVEEYAHRLLTAEHPVETQAPADTNQ